MEAGRTRQVCAAPEQPAELTARKFRAVPGPTRRAATSKTTTERRSHAREERARHDRLPSAGVEQEPAARSAPSAPPREKRRLTERSDNDLALRSSAEGVTTEKRWTAMTVGAAQGRECGGTESRRPTIADREPRNPARRQAKTSGISARRGVCRVAQRDFERTAGDSDLQTAAQNGLLDAVAAACAEHTSAGQPAWARSAAKARAIPRSPATTPRTTTAASLSRDRPADRGTPYPEWHQQESRTPDSD